MAMIIAKLLTTTILRGRETAPFVMEMPSYHLPTVTGVLRRAFDRTWVYIKKVGTIVVAVAVCVYVLLQFPGLPQERAAFYEGKMDRAIEAFEKQTSKTGYNRLLQGEQILEILNVSAAYRDAKLTATTAEASKKVDTQLELLIEVTTFQRKIEKEILNQNQVDKVPDREKQLLQILQEAIFVLEESREAFRSKQLECLRKRLTKVLVDIRQTG